MRAPIKFLKTRLLMADASWSLYAEEHMSTVNVSDGIGEALEPTFEEIFREQYRMAYRTAYGVIGNSEDADDVAQTIFLRLLHREFPKDLVKNPKAYLYRAAVNESLNLIRSRKRSILTGDVERFEAPPAVDESAEDIHRSLYEAVAKLNPGAAHILVLRYVHKYSLGEIAKLLGTTRSTIAVSLFRSRARLKKWMRASSLSGGKS
jgi:RNA polymerase sigma-70 factor (ECF subfamily)